MVCVKYITIEQTVWLRSKTLGLLVSNCPLCETEHLKKTNRTNKMYRNQNAKVIFLYQRRGIVWCNMYVYSTGCSTWILTKENKYCNSGQHGYFDVRKIYLQHFSISTLKNMCTFWKYFYVYPYGTPCICMYVHCMYTFCISTTYRTCTYRLSS